MRLGNVEKPLIDAIAFLEQAVRLDPKFTLAYCACTTAHDGLYFLYGPTPERRALGDAALNSGHAARSEEHTSELQSRQYLVCRLLLEKKKRVHVAGKQR